VRERFTSTTTTAHLEIGGETWQTGTYRYTVFGTCYMYAYLVFEGNTLIKKEVQAVYSPPSEWHYLFDRENEGYGFGRDTGTDSLPFTSDDITAALEYTPAPPLSIHPIDTYPDSYNKWGGKLVYTYKVLVPGEITATLVGGGAGGTGGAASDGNGGAQAGWSGNGGDTILRVKREVSPEVYSEVSSKTAPGGAGKIGLETTHGTNPGFNGDDAPPVSYRFSVRENDIITIEI
jgi:hypothetical protein